MHCETDRNDSSPVDEKVEENKGYWAGVRMQENCFS